MFKDFIHTPQKRATVVVMVFGWFVTDLLIREWFYSINLEMALGTDPYDGMRFGHLIYWLITLFSLPLMIVVWSMVLVGYPGRVRMFAWNARGNLFTYLAWTALCLPVAALKIRNLWLIAGDEGMAYEKLFRSCDTLIWMYFTVLAHAALVFRKPVAPLVFREKSLVTRPDVLNALGRLEQREREKALAPRRE